MNDSRLNRWLNRATGSGGVSYPPGSIFKLISAVAYLEEGLIDPDEKVYNPGYFRDSKLYPNYELDDTAPPGDYDFIRAFKRSSNTYFIHHALKPDGQTTNGGRASESCLTGGTVFGLAKRRSPACPVTCPVPFVRVAVIFLPVTTS